MKYVLFLLGFLISGMDIPAESRLFTWNLQLSGSWEESKTLHNRGNVRLGLPLPALTLRAQAIDRRTLHFDVSAGESPWGDPSKALSSAAAGLYHQDTGSRLLYGILDEWGLPARIRSPWIRAAPYTENHKPIMADMRTSVSSTKTPEAYLYLSSPRFRFFEQTALPVRMRAFTSGQMSADTAEGNKAPAFSGGLETAVGKNTDLLLEGFYTSAELPARSGSAWFNDPPALPARDFRLTAAALMLNTPYVSVSSDWAWSETFAGGSGIYANAALRLSPPLNGNTAGKNAQGGPWSLSLAADGSSERYVGRDGTSVGEGLRAAGKIEWKGTRSSLFRINTVVRGSGLEEDFERSASGIYYRFPSVRSGGGGFPLRVSRISFNADRNAADLNKIYDSIDGNLGLSLSLPPLSLPGALLPASARTVKKSKPQYYPLGINLSVAIKERGSAAQAPAPYPFFPVDDRGMAFDSCKGSGEFIWSPGIFQFRTRWAHTMYAEKDNQWEGSISSAVRFKHGRFSTKIAWPEFPQKWNCTLSWRGEFAGAVRKGEKKEEKNAGQNTVSGL